ncbi:MAG: hypothetical protein NTZ51_08970 [Proteobacteria bacterium]|nr:hypothetical protein [Pseudomonadota bacterium]
MVKKVLILLLICSFFAAILPMQTRAAQQPAKEAVLENLIISMQHALQKEEQPGELSLITSRTQILLDDLLIALKNKDSASLKSIIDEYAADMATLQVQGLDPACVWPLLLEVYYETVGMVQTVSAAPDQTCLVIKLTDIIADLISTVQTYEICVIDNSENPEDPARPKIVHRQVFVKICSFIASTLNLVLCTQQPGLIDYVNLFLEFAGIFPTPPPEVPLIATVH